MKQEAVIAKFSSLSEYIPRPPYVLVSVSSFKNETGHRESPRRRWIASDEGLTGLDSAVPIVRFQPLMNHPLGVVEDLHHGAGWPAATPGATMLHSALIRSAPSRNWMRYIIGLNVPPGARFQSGSSGPKAAQKRRHAASIPAAPPPSLSPRARR
jgi:hypothetical protein